MTFDLQFDQNASILSGFGHLFSRVHVQIQLLRLLCEAMSLVSNLFTLSSRHPNENYRESFFEGFCLASDVVTNLTS